jgi:nicotinamide riboside transporter PnuC
MIYNSWVLFIPITFGAVLVFILKVKAGQSIQGLRNNVLLAAPLIMFAVEILTISLTTPPLLNMAYAGLIALSFMGYFGYLNVREKRVINVIVGIIFIALYCWIIFRGLLYGLDDIYPLGPR